MEFLDDRLVRIGSTVFRYGFPLEDVPPGQLGIAKDRPLLERYAALWSQLRPRLVVELGLHQGGSAVMMCELGGVQRIVSVDRSPAPVEALDRHIAARGLEAVLRPYRGIDQADQGRLAAIVDEAFAGAPLDLVIDDASHRYRESRASFEVLFPRLRPGGLYVLEDWRWAHTVSARMAAALERSDDLRRELHERMLDEGRSAPDTPVSRLIVEIVIALGISAEFVADVAIDPDCVVVRRGPAAVDPRAFRIADVAPDHLGLLAPIR